MADSESVPTCSGHGLPARIYTSQKNSGRQFYRCPKPIGSEQCNYFVWLDELPWSSQINVLPPTPQSAVRTSQTNPGPPSTPTAAQPLKRRFSDVEEHDEGSVGPISPASQKRTRIMEETLSGSRPGPSTDFKGKNKLVYGEPISDEGPDGTWPPQTPPRAQRSLNLGRSASTSSISPMATLGPRQAVDESNTSTNAEPSSQGTLPPSSQGTLPDDGELSADSIADMIHRLGNFPEYVRKLERKKTAAEKSRDAKASKIAYLEKEVERLKAREKQLEEVIDESN